MGPFLEIGRFESAGRTYALRVAGPEQLDIVRILEQSEFTIAAVRQPASEHPRLYAGSAQWTRQRRQEMLAEAMRIYREWTTRVVPGS